MTTSRALTLSEQLSRPSGMKTFRRVHYMQVEGYVWWRHKRCADRIFSFVHGTYSQYRVICFTHNVVSCFDIIMLLVVYPSTVAVVNPSWLNHAEAVFVDYCPHNAPKHTNKKMLFTHTRYSSSATPLLDTVHRPKVSRCSCMESIPTIRANQSRHVKTLTDRMCNSRKHHHHLVLKGSNDVG